MHYADIDPVAILDYIYSLGLTSCLCIIGSFLREYYRMCRFRSKISFINVLVPSIFTAFILTFGVLPYINNLYLNVYIIGSLLCGMWSNVLLEFVFNASVVAVFIKNIFKQIKNPVMKGISDSISELEKKDTIKKIDTYMEKGNGNTKKKKEKDDEEDKIINIDDIPR